MNTRPRFLSSHRTARITRWATLWLNWFVWCFLACFPIFHPGRQAARKGLDYAAQVVRSIIFIHACRRVRIFAQPHRYGRLKRRGRVRAAMGWRLRKALRGKTDFDRLAAMYTMLADPEPHIAALVPRLRRGLTRRRRIAPARTRAPRLPLIARPPAIADSS
jgi:hypothetical protein